MSGVNGVSANGSAGRGRGRGSRVPSAETDAPGGAGRGGLGPISSHFQQVAAVEPEAEAAGASAGKTTTYTPGRFGRTKVTGGAELTFSAAPPTPAPAPTTAAGTQPPEGSRLRKWSKEKTTAPMPTYTPTEDKADDDEDFWGVEEEKTEPAPVPQVASNVSDEMAKMRREMEEMQRKMQSLEKEKELERERAETERQKREALQSQEKQRLREQKEAAARKEAEQKEAEALEARRQEDKRRQALAKEEEARREEEERRAEQQRLDDEARREQRLQEEEAKREKERKAQEKERLQKERQVEKERRQREEAVRAAEREAKKKVCNTHHALLPPPITSVCTHIHGMCPSSQTVATGGTRYTSFQQQYTTLPLLLPLLSNTQTLKHPNITPRRRLQNPQRTQRSKLTPPMTTLTSPPCTPLPRAGRHSPQARRRPRSLTATPGLSRQTLLPCQSRRRYTPHPPSQPLFCVTARTALCI